MSSALETLMVPSAIYDDITTAVSQYLWQHRGFDLVAQSFVVLAAIICCIAMLKVRRDHE